MTLQSPGFSYKAEMGFTHRELLKGLPSAVEPYTVSRISDCIYEMTSEDRLVRLTMQPERVRKIASIRLPITDVELLFFGFEQNQYDAFMWRFKKYLQRGGG